MVLLKDFPPACLFLWVLAPLAHSQGTLQNTISSLVLSPLLENVTIKSQTAFNFTVSILNESFSDKGQSQSANLNLEMDFSPVSDQKMEFLKGSLASNNTRVQFYSAYLLQSCYSIGFPLNVSYFVLETNSEIASNTLQITINCEDISSDEQLSIHETTRTSFKAVIAFLIISVFLFCVLLAYWYSKKRKQIGYTMRDFELQAEDEKTNGTESTDRKIQEEINNYNHNLLKRRRKNRKTGTSSDNSDSMEDVGNKSLDFPPNDNKDDSEKMMNVKELADLSNIHSTTVFKPDLSISYSIVNEIKDGENKQLFTNERPIMEELNEE